MKDEELDNLLAQFRQEKPSQFQIQKWKRRVRKELIKIPGRYWIQIVAASVIGFAMGVLFSERNIVLEKNSEDATVEYVFVNTY